ncbi:hypothetical protein H8D57_01970 [bacterium]|nr:hypothetical protein [bacterium]
MHPDPIHQFLLGTDVIGDIRRQALSCFDVVTCIPRQREFRFGFEQKVNAFEIGVHRTDFDIVFELTMGLCYKVEGRLSRTDEIDEVDVSFLYLNPPVYRWHFKCIPFIFL